MDKNVQFDNFVGVYDGFYTSDYCKAMIDYLEYMDSMGKTWQRDYTTEVNKSDTSLNIIEPNSISFSRDNLGPHFDTFTKTFWQECYPSYSKEYSILRTLPQQMIYTIKVQRTKPTEGYHIWHCESSGRDMSSRMAVFMLYLNTIREGGETEFLYTEQRIKPVEGRLLIWPAGYTHTHRGNPPLGGQTKYVITGWVEFVN
jgi:hypothetical protein